MILYWINLDLFGSYEIVGLLWIAMGCYELAELSMARHMAHSLGLLEP